MVKVGEVMKKILCLISIVIVIGAFLFLHHEQSLALEKKYKKQTITKQEKNLTTFKLHTYHYLKIS